MVRVPSFGMMNELAIENAEAKKVFEIADCSLGRSISTLCFDGTQDDLNLTLIHSLAFLLLIWRHIRQLHPMGLCRMWLRGFL